MTVQQLLENTHLAALGLLDADEHNAFERALASAPESVRMQVLREQARWSSGQGLLPNVEPPAELRERVLDNVRAAMFDAEIARTAQEVGQSRRVPALWRTSAIGLLAACVALGAAFLHVYRNTEQTRSTIADIRTSESMLTTIGPRFVDDVLFDRSTVHVAFTKADPTFAGKVSMYVNENWSESRLFSSNLPELPEDRTYRLVELNGADEVVGELLTLSGHVQTQSTSVRKIERGMRIALVVAPVAQIRAYDRILAVANIA